MMQIRSTIEIEFIRFHSSRRMNILTCMKNSNWIKDGRLIVKISLHSISSLGYDVFGNSVNGVDLIRSLRTMMDILSH